MAIGEICAREVITVTKDTPIPEVARLMKRHNIGNIIVIEKTTAHHFPIGVITDRDIVTKVVAQGIDLESVTVGDIMNEDMLILSKHQELQEALEMMCAKGVRRAPIINDGHELIGIAAIDDIFLLIAEEIGSLTKIIRKQIV